MLVALRLLKGFAVISIVIGGGYIRMIAQAKAPHLVDVVIGECHVL
jgi:hypothetical protein